MLLDAVLHVAARAVEFFVQGLCRPWFTWQRGHHKTRILFSVDVFRFGHHAPLAVPAPLLGLLGTVFELGKYPRRFTGLVPLLGRFMHLCPDDLPQPLIARQT